MTKESWRARCEIGPKLTEIGPIFDFQEAAQQAVVNWSQKLYQKFTKFYRILIF
jgi:hypothetical protein